MADYVSRLSLDLWIVIFEHIQPTPTNVEWGFHCSAVEAQTTLWHLPLVCKTFHNALTAHPELDCQVFLDKHMLKTPSSNISASLVPWMQARADIIRSFHAQCYSVAVAKYLQALEGPSSTLTAVSWTPKDTMELQSLASFTSLTSCCLGVSRYTHAPLDLRPLQGLHNLTRLALQQGPFNNLSAVSFLTSLNLQQACIDGSYFDFDSSYCKFASTLVELRMMCSEVYKLHPRGLLGCNALESLVVWRNCHIGAVDDADIFDIREEGRPNGEFVGPCQCPWDCSALVCLTDVKLHIKDDMGIDLSGIASLPNLCSLEVEAPYPYIDHSFQHQSKLTNLCIDAGESPFVWSLDCRALPTLQQLEISGGISISPEMWGLVRLPHLRHVNLKAAEPYDTASRPFLETLSQLFREDQPDILFEPCT